MIGDPEGIGGTIGGRYAIEREAGRGATAIVYRCRDQHSGRVVAVKILRSALLASAQSERFLREVRHHQRLQHPGILPILDSGHVEGRPFLVLPYVDGGTLRDRLNRQRQLPYAEALRIAREIADSLAHAHGAGVLHRDVKPENILFSGDHALLGDFGIARALEQATGDSTTSTGIVRGTPAYMSPEQAGGEARYDGRSDIYSLACVLYEMVAGVAPFVGPSAQSVIAQRLSFPPTPLTRYRDSVPAALDALISKAMMLSPADRFQAAGEFALTLASIEAEILRPGHATVQRRRTSRRGWALGLAGAGGVAMIAAIRALLTTPSPYDPYTIPEGDPRRIAVLYLSTQTPAVLPEHVADGITEDLIDRLGQVPALHVTSSSGVRALRRDPVPLDSIRRVLKVGTIVEGSVARSGDVLRVNVRLVDALTGQQLDSRTLQERWTELFSLQDRLAEQVQFWLRQRLGDVVALREQREGTRSIPAWEAGQLASAETRRAVVAATLRGDTTSPSLFLRADSLYVRASSLDPRWLHPVVKRGNLALLALAIRSPRPPRDADSAAYQSMSRLERRIAWTLRALELADEALTMRPGHAGALALRGQARVALSALRGPEHITLLDGAERDLRASLQERPNLAAAWTALAELMLRRGRFADAADAARRGYEADAFFELPRVLDVAFTASLWAEQFGPAATWCDLGLSRYPGDPRFMECRIRLLGSAGRGGRDAQRGWLAIREIERRDTLGLLRATWGFRRLMVAAVLARSGLRDSARSILDAVTSQQSEIARRPSEAAACYVLTLLGERDEAIRRLGELLRAGMSPAAAPVPLLPWFRQLHGDARFDSLARLQPAGAEAAR